jgi:hypothetical protein
MAVPAEGHISDETGRVSGVSRALLGTGLALTGAGILLFLVAVFRGLLRAADGSSAADTMLPWLPLGGVVTVVGLAVAAGAMFLARRSAGE